MVVLMIQLQRWWWRPGQQWCCWLWWRCWRWFCFSFVVHSCPCNPMTRCQTAESAQSLTPTAPRQRRLASSRHVKQSLRSQSRLGQGFKMVGDVSWWWWCLIFLNELLIFDHRCRLQMRLKPNKDWEISVCIHLFVYWFHFISIANTMIPNSAQPVSPMWPGSKGSALAGRRGWGREGHEAELDSGTSAKRGPCWCFCFL